MKTQSAVINNSKAQMGENSKQKACIHDYYQIPRCNLAKCKHCGTVRFRQQKEYK